VSEAEAGAPEDDLRTVLVIVPDNQLSLAIGKKGQNARLAAKLTGFRVDIKSEGEVEDERRRDEEERTQGRESLAHLPGVGPQIVERLVDAGLHSPARVVAGGLPALRELPGIGETKASAILAAAQAWVAEHPEAPAVGGEPEAPAAEDGGSEIEPSHLGT
jgi:N utilization substance protein A